MTYFNRGFPLQPFRLLATPSGSIPPIGSSFSGMSVASVVFTATATGAHNSSGVAASASVTFHASGTAVHHGSGSPSAFVTFTATASGTNPAFSFGPFFFAGSEADTNQYGGSVTDAHAGYGGSVTDANAGYGGTVNAGGIGAMQAVNITLGEFNDETIDLAITNNSSPFNLTGFGLQVLLKTAPGVQDTDASTLTFSTAGGSPAITITNASGGLAVLVIPHASLATTGFTFWRCDVTQSGQQVTAMYGTVTIKSL